MAHSLLRGHVDIATPREIKGWAWDAAAPGRSVGVELVQGGAVIARATASLMRKDLLDAGVGTGLYGFAFTLGESVLPFSHNRLRVRFSDDQSDVPGSPLTVTGPGRDDLRDIDDIAGILAGRIETLDEAAPLARLVTVLAEALDKALERQWMVGRPALAPAAAMTTGDPVSFADAVTRIRARYAELAVAPEKKPVVSVVVTSADQFADAHGAILSVLASRCTTPIEVILVDDASTDETLIARSILPPAVRIHRNPARVGRLKACKAGQALAQGQYVLFLDARARIAPGGIDAMRAVFSDVPGAGIVGPRLLDPEGFVSAAGLTLSADGGLALHGHRLPESDPRTRYRREVDAVPGHVLMVDKALAVRLRGYDERYSASCFADADLAMRARAARRTVIVQPAATAVIGLDPVTLDPSTGLAQRMAVAEDRQLFVQLWSSELGDPVFAKPVEPASRWAKGQALVIDHAYPTPWADAGSNAVVSHMRALQELGLQVNFVPGGPAERDPRSTPMLERHGIACFHDPHATSVGDVLRQIGPALDVVYIHRLSNARGYIDEVRRLAPNARILFSVADLHFLREERQAALANDAGRAAAAAALREAELAVAAKADGVITHSDVEAGLLRAALPQASVAVVPWLVPARPVTRPVAERSGVAFIGGAGHAPNIDAARWLVDEIMPRVHAKDPSIRCFLVGEGMMEAFAGVARPWLTVLGWVQDLHDQVFERVRLTVAPLRFGAGVKGKVLESLACGVPCIMTPLAAEGIPLPDAARRWVRDTAADLADAVVAQHDGTLASPQDVEEASRVVREMCGSANVRNRLAEIICLKSREPILTNTSDPDVTSDEESNGSDAPAQAAARGPLLAAALS